MSSETDKPTRREPNEKKIDERRPPTLMGTCFLNNKGHKIAECPTKILEEVAQPQLDNKVVRNDKPGSNRKLLGNNC